MNNGAGQSEGHGLMSMCERAERLGGELEVVSASGQGTTVSLRVPLHPRNWFEKPKVEDPRRRKAKQDGTGKSRLFARLSRPFRGEKD